MDQALNIRRQLLERFFTLNNITLAIDENNPRPINQQDIAVKLRARKVNCTLCFAVIVLSAVMITLYLLTDIPFLQSLPPVSIKFTGLLLFMAILKINAGLMMIAKLNEQKFIAGLIAQFQTE